MDVFRPTYDRGCYWSGDVRVDELKWFGNVQIRPFGVRLLSALVDFACWARSGRTGEFDSQLRLVLSSF